jgi:GAF domain
MTGKGEKGQRPGTTGQEGSATGLRRMSFDALRLRARQLSLREQLERHHFLLERLQATSTRLIQAVEQGHVFEAIGEIIGNLIGTEEAAIFLYCAAQQALSPVWSTGVSEEILRQFALGVGLVGRAAHEGASQFRHRQPAAPLLPCEENLTACVPLKLDREVIGVIVILGLLPHKNRLDWVDFELLKLLETYGAVAVELQRLQKDG